MKDFIYQQKIPHIHTKLPGPNAEKLIARDHKVTSTSYTRDYPLAVNQGYGVGIEDVDGNWFLDFTAGIAVTNTGHCHPKVVESVVEQSKKIMHMCGTDFYLDPLMRLAEKLCELVPGKYAKRCFFSNSGTEAVEAALKLARNHTKRTKLIGFHGAFHGRTMGSLSITASKSVQRQGFAPFMPEVYHAKYNDLSILEQLFKQCVPPEEVAGIIVEPIQGEGGYVVGDAKFMHGLRELCNRHGIILIMDEIQAGIGRTGKMFGHEHFGMEADIVCTAKGLASGLPLGAIIAKESIMTWKPGNHGSTFGGNPVACAAAVTSLELIQDHMMANAARMGEILRNKLFELQRKHKYIGDIRGMGLMMACDIVDESCNLNPKLRMQLVVDSFYQGLLLLPCGESAIRFIPALCISEDHLIEGLNIFDSVVAKAKKSN